MLGLSCFVAISLLFQERTVYTQEVLSVVLHQLMDLTPLPTLFMRTVCSSNSLCTSCVDFFVSNHLLVCCF